MEMIVATALFALFATFAITVLNPFEQYKKAQAGEIKSDLAQIQRALEIYYNDFGQYPAHSTINPTYQIVDQSNQIGWGESWKPYIDVLPPSPNGSYVYYATGDQQSYYIYASISRGDKDPDTCNDGGACSSLQALGIPESACGDICNYGVSSPNVSP